MRIDNLPAWFKSLPDSSKYLRYCSTNTEKLRETLKVWSFVLCYQLDGDFFFVGLNTEAEVIDFVADRDEPIDLRFIRDIHQEKFLRPVFPRPSLEEADRP